MKQKTLIILSLLLMSTATWAGQKIERPKLVVGLVVDQMRWDYLYYYYEDFVEGGLKRLVDEGYSCENTMINYVPTVTGIGHASIYTGSTPALHGICGNNFYDKGQYAYCCGDASVNGVGSDSKAGKMSPRNMLANTIGDQLRLSNDFKSRVFGVALKDRAAILPAGHSANAAYWYDNSVGHFISSTYYMQELPKWVRDFNKHNATKPGEDQKMKPEGITLTFKMAEALLENERLGANDVTDMLCVSISSTDAIAHEYGTRGEQTIAAYKQLDKDLAHFLKVLDQRIGRGKYLLFLSADHGGAHNPNFMRKNKLPADGWGAGKTVKAISSRLAEKYGVEKLALGHYSDFIYLNHARIDSAGLDLQEVKREAIREIEKNDKILYAVDCANATTAPIPQLIRERIVNGYNRLRTGDIYCLPRSQMFTWEFKDDYIGTTHGEWNPYDAHIPLVFFGWNVEHGATTKPTRIVDIAPTVCAMLHIQMPNACIGDAVELKD
ncbi:MAG: alkaline phosphatase family protein [Prevotella sp.]|nr:alkaline phosphatase family protein [Prevotella sp.]